MKNEIYKGKARIVNIGAEELAKWAKEKLNDADRENAFDLVFECETQETPPRRFAVKCEISHRTLTGKALEWYRRPDGKTPTALDITLKDLKKQGLLTKDATEADIGAVMADAYIGREVTISVTEDAREDGTYWPPRARFASPFTRLTGQAAANRFAAFLTGKPAAAKVEAAADDDNDPIQF